MQCSRKITKYPKFGGGGINQPGQLVPGVEDNQGGGKISPTGVKLSRGGGGGKINCYTGLTLLGQPRQFLVNSKFDFNRKWLLHL